MPRNFTNFFEVLGIAAAERRSAAKKAAYEDVPSNFRAVEPRPHTRSLHPELGGAIYHLTWFLFALACGAVVLIDSIRRPKVSVDLVCFAVIVAVGMRVLGW